MQAALWAHHSCPSRPGSLWLSGDLQLNSQLQEMRARVGSRARAEAGRRSSPLLSSRRCGGERCDGGAGEPARHRTVSHGFGSWPREHRRSEPWPIYLSFSEAYSVSLHVGSHQFAAITPASTPGARRARSWAGVELHTVSHLDREDRGQRRNPCSLRPCAARPRRSATRGCAAVACSRRTRPSGPRSAAHSRDAPARSARGYRHDRAP